jgi:uncharacterized protein YjbJ (UPF0337 family)
VAPDLFFLAPRASCAFRNKTVHRTFIPRLSPNQKPITKESDMNWDRVEGNWTQFKGKVQQQWGNLTNDDLDVVEGKRKELSGKIQERYGVAKDEAEKQIDDWLTRAN